MNAFWQLGLYDPQGVEYDNRCVHWSYDLGNNMSERLEHAMCVDLARYKWTIIIIIIMCVCSSDSDSWVNFTKYSSSLLDMLSQCNRAVWNWEHCYKECQGHS